MPSSAPPADQRHSWSPLLFAGAVAAVYALAHFLWFANTPLGRVPVLDARENISLANNIVNGSLAAEPFYRAPGYALLLALLRIGGIAPNALFVAALLLGVLFHAANATLVAAIARASFGRSAGTIAGLLYALNPVLVHFAIQAGDATPAITCFLAGLYFLVCAATTAQNRRLGYWMAASVAWALATALRPNYFLIWLVLPLIAVQRTHTLRPAVAALAGVVVFIALGTWQMKVCGRFGFLPSQGAYNLWAANAPGSQGRYYTQKLALPADLAAMNPARAESLLLYRRATGTRSATLDEANAYWRARFVGYVTHHPLAFVAKLGRKAYALLNDWEQYNNETPAFHLRRSPWLRWNPLGWGVLLVLAVPGAIRLAGENRAAAWTFAIVASALAGSALLFFVSARFRLPLVAPLTILAGGAIAGARTLLAPRRRRAPILIGCGLAAIVAFSGWDNVRDRATFVQDHALLARAAATVGDDTLAWSEANAALQMRPDHPDALRLAVTSYFNLLLDGRANPHAERAWREEAQQCLRTIDDDELRAVAGIAVWRGGDRETAMREWKAHPCATASAARALVGEPGAAMPATNLEATGSALARIARGAIVDHDPASIRRAKFVFTPANP